MLSLSSLARWAGLLLRYLFDLFNSRRDCGLLRLTDGNVYARLFVCCRGVCLSPRGRRVDSVHTDVPLQRACIISRREIPHQDHQQGSARAQTPASRALRGPADLLWLCNYTVPIKRLYAMVMCINRGPIRCLPGSIAPKMFFRIDLI